MSEYERVKAWRQANRKPCSMCGVEVAYDTTLCRKCHGKNRTALAKKVTLGELKELHGKWWGARVRLDAQRSYKGEMSCKKCKYDKHVEIAHLRPVADFPNSATLLEVNEVNNLTALCPNHHWEYDNASVTE